MSAPYVKHTAREVYTAHWEPLVLEAQGLSESEKKTVKGLLYMQLSKMFGGFSLPLSIQLQKGEEREQARRELAGILMVALSGRIDVSDGLAEKAVKCIC